MTATVETMEYAAMMRRMVRAYGRRVADADVEDLAELIALRAQLDETIASAVSSSRERHGRSWADIARATGTTRQAAQQRFGRQGSLDTEPPATPDLMGALANGRVAA
jgi:hypothetical protein